MSQNNQSPTLSAKNHSKGLGYGLLFFQKRPKTLFFVFLALTLLLYFPTMQSGFVTDVTGGIEKIQNQPFQNVIHSFGFPALNQISVFFFYVWYQIFGGNGFPWYFAFCSLHALNAFLAYTLFKTLLLHFKLKNAPFISLLGVLFFLTHPYQTEVLVWRACFNYLLVTAFLLLSLIHLVRYLDTNQQKYLYFLHGFFITALFTFELALMLPFISFCFYVIWLWYFRKLAQFKYYFYWISIPHFLGLVGYFGLNKLALGNWIGHYGAATHLQFSIVEMSNTLLKYILKYSFLCGRTLIIIKKLFLIFVATMVF